MLKSTSNTGRVQAYVSDDGKLQFDAGETVGPYVEGRTVAESRAVAMREMTLTVEEATALQERLNHPTTQPARPPRLLPVAAASILQQPSQ
ncbi:MAG: hypothetical protein ACR2PL_03810 [Dehalococcoidia bacterium]